MQRWAGSSDLRRVALRLVGVAGLVAALVPPGLARVYLTAEEAAALAFPGAAVERQALFLTEAELARVRTLAGTDVASALVTRFTAQKDGALVGTAYLDTHRVRTLPETLFVVLDPQATLRRIEVLSFSEPAEYLPRAAWFQQFDGRALDGELSLKSKIRPVAGATLTARAVTEAARRVLAVHRVLAERAAR